MTNLDVYKELTRLLTLTTATPQDTQSAFNIYRIVVTGDVNLCATCPSNIRAAFKRLQSYYNNESEYLKANPNEMATNR